MQNLGIDRGTSFDLDFHTIPFHGEDALVEKHYVSKRSRKQKGILAFLAQDANTRVFFYANSDLDTSNVKINRRHIAEWAVVKLRLKPSELNCLVMLFSLLLVLWIVR